MAQLHTISILFKDTSVSIIVGNIVQPHNLIPVLSSSSFDREVAARQLAHPSTVDLFGLVLLDQILRVLGQLQMLHREIVHTMRQLLTVVSQRVHGILSHKQQSQEGQHRFRVVDQILQPADCTMARAIEKQEEELAWS